MKNSSIYIVIALSFVWGSPVFALVSANTLAPIIQPKTIIAPVPVKIVVPTNVTAGKTETELMPADPLEKPTVSISTTEKIIMPPDDFGKTAIPPDPFDKPTAIIPTTEKTIRPPDPLERNAMPPDDFGKVSMPDDPLDRNTMPDDPFGTQTASLRLVNEITKGGMVSEPGKLENTGPRIFKNISEKDLEQPELATVFAKEVKTAMPGVKNIALEEKTVQVTYEREAKVFGFVPVKYEMTAEGNIETGKVKVAKPWWLIFAKNDAGKFESALNDSRDTIGELGEITSLKMQMDMDRRAKIIETLSNIIKKISQTEESIIQNMK
ncbi:MAG: hypothetical protein WC878_02860 [Candidatus Paceibacterota bacterium]